MYFIAKGNMQNSIHVIYSFPLQSEMVFLFAPS